MKFRSRANDLKERLDWGEPALTIIDVRERDAFHFSHITGAISIPLAELSGESLACCLEFDRDIYLYGATNEQTAEAAACLRKAGYRNVAELIGGLAAWKANGYPMEGISSAVA